MKEVLLPFFCVVFEAVLLVGCNAQRPNQGPDQTSETLIRRGERQDQQGTDMNEPSRSLVLTKLQHCFPDEQSSADALALLDTYDAEASQPGRARIQLAILKLSQGDLEKLRDNLEVAKTDYRDTLAWAEYPEQMQSSASDQEVQERDRKQYLDWLQHDGC